ncbi:MAG: hypothetical protein ABSH50_23490 [Bryobacteraceae bacterium]|jgi:hypothetical protein
MKVEEYSERVVDVEPWQVRLSSYKLGETYHCKADNVSPGAALARTTGPTRAAAEEKALERARHMLARSIRHNA